MVAVRELKPLAKTNITVGAVEEGQVVLVMAHKELPSVLIVLSMLVAFLLCKIHLMVIH
tara:strand:- start:133 stop:309 length:177 start_codon:yes stop_codon:yes gene_type:complete